MCVRAWDLSEPTRVLEEMPWLRSVAMSASRFEVKTSGNPPGRYRRAEEGAAHATGSSHAHAQEPRGEKETTQGSLVLLGITQQVIPAVAGGKSRLSRAEAWSDLCSRRGAPVLVCKLGAPSLQKGCCMSMSHRFSR